MYKQYIKIISFAFMCSVYNSNVSAQSEPVENKPEPHACFTQCLSDIAEDGKNCLKKHNKKFTDCVENTEVSYQNCIDRCI